MSTHRDPRRTTTESDENMVAFVRLTATGRATVEPLVMHDDHAVRARSPWVLLDLFPS